MEQCIQHAAAREHPARDRPGQGRQLPWVCHALSLACYCYLQSARDSASIVKRLPDGGWSLPPRRTSACACARPAPMLLFVCPRAELSPFFPFRHIRLPARQPSPNSYCRRFPPARRRSGPLSPTVIRSPQVRTLSAHSPRAPSQAQKRADDDFPPA